MSLLRFLFILILLPPLVHAQTYTKRLALVIGNSNYQNGGVLKNPINDARSIASTLQSMGFEVMKYENVSQPQLKQAINAYGIKLKEFEVGLFYYAGHGIQHKGSNYMIPVEADLQAAEQIEYDCVAADRVLAYMESASTKVNIIIMDACRNNPFERSWHRSVNGNGLAMMNAPTGSLIAYATAPGQVASDGESSNGLYTSALLKYLKDPGLNIEQVFKRVRTDVSEKSFGAQIPWETTSLTGSDFYFNNTKSQAVSNTTATASTAMAGNADSEKALAFYSSATGKYDKKLYAEAFDDYKKAIELNPLHIEAHLWGAHCLYALTKYQEALLAYNKVLELSPGEAQAYYYRGLCKYYTEQSSEAIADFSIAVRYDPTNANAFYWRGYCYSVKGNYYAAIEDYTKTIALSPTYAEVYYYRGLANYNAQDYAKGIEDFKQAITLGDNHKDVSYWTASSNLMMKKYDEAVKDYTAYLQQNAESADAYYWRANAYYQLNQSQQALSDVNKAMQIDPKNETYATFKRDTLKK
jgi:tetratricopeptide (TPR) repeat protein